MGAESAASKHTKGGPRKADRRPKPKMTKEERRKKYTDIARKRRQKQNGNRRGGDRRKTFVCYNCRMPGHSAAECPSLAGNSNTADHSVCKPVPTNGAATVLCYKCGSTEHALHNCPKRHRGDRSDLPFATCFICKEKGHLASACPKNKTGIYVNGGCCRTCGSQQHLASDCPERKKRKKGETERVDEEQAHLGDLVGEPSSTVSETKREMKEKKKKSASIETTKKKRVVNF